MNGGDYYRDDMRGMNGAGDIFEESDRLLKITGTVDTVVYQNEENGYSVVELETDGGEPVTVVGTMPYVGVGERITASGEWMLHPQYGRQFKAEYYEKELPAGETDILRYLSSGNIRGIGAKTARRIVERYGGETFDVIENHPEWLADISGITAAKAKKIGEDFRDKAGARSIIMFCRDYFSSETAMSIYKKWGGGAVELIKKNPYKLCGDFSGIGFMRADRIALSLGIAADDKNRLHSGIEYVLSANAHQNGHTCCPRSVLIEKAAETLQTDAETVAAEVDSMQLSGALVRLNAEDGGDALIFTDYYYKAEKYTADKLAALDRYCPKIRASDAGRYITQIERERSIVYAELQKKAIFSALESGVFVLTGGPGTGKTTVIMALLAIFDDMGFNTALAAPTGRAAKRMSEATGCEAKTIHRLLEMEYSDDRFPRFMRNEDNMLEENVVIIDETSMVDSLLMASLLKAIKHGSRLILIGDADQLPPVGAGNVLNDIIGSGFISTVRLTEIYRQSAESRIVVNAHAVNRGEFPDLRAKSDDFFFIYQRTDRDTAATVADLWKNRLPKAYGAETEKRIQVITPSRRGESGTEKLNLRLQSVLNPLTEGKKEMVKRDYRFREGDRVMQIKNNYTIEWVKDEVQGVGIFNGDIGKILEIDTENAQLIIDFDERVVNYDFALTDELEHAWAITVHKSQGSEYPIVIIPLYGCPAMLLTRNLIYTAITRAKSMVILVGDANILARMIDNDRHVERETGLRRMLAAADKP